MSKRKRSKILSVRVKYEPNRFSQDCLQQVYKHFSPTVAVCGSPAPDHEPASVGDLRGDIDVVKMPGGSQ